MTENQKKWLKALRSGNFKQGKTFLNSGNNFCCLGVAAELFKTKDTNIENFACIAMYDDCEASAPKYVIEALGLYNKFGIPHDYSHLMALSSLNDQGKSFNEIADIIEKNPSAYFKEV